MHTQGRRALVLLARTGICFALLAVSASAHALTCMPRQHTLKEAFAAADSIVVGLVTECEEEISSEPYANGGSNCAFSALEVLKDAFPVRDYSGVASSSGCGLSLGVGQRYLLFLDKDNKPLRFSESLDARTFRTPILNEYLEALRSFRSGVDGDLAEPWVFAEQDGHCSLTQVVGRDKFSFVYRATGKRLPNEPKHPNEPTWEKNQANGETVYSARVQATSPGVQEPTGTVDLVVYDGMPETDGGIVFIARIDDETPALRRIATLTVGTRSWPLQRMEMHFQHSATKAQFQTVEYRATGERAQELLDALTEAAEFQFSASVVANEAVSADQSTDFGQTDTHAGFKSKKNFLGEVPPKIGVATAQAPTGPGVSSATRRHQENVVPILRTKSRGTQRPDVASSFVQCAKVAP